MLFGCVWSTVAADTCNDILLHGEPVLHLLTCNYMLGVCPDLMLVSAGADSQQPQHCQCQEEHRADIWQGHFPVQPPVIAPQ